MLSRTDALEAVSLLQQASRVSCICHRNPDGDAIGAILGMTILLESAFPEKQVFLYCKDPAPETFRFLPGALRIQQPPAVSSDSSREVIVILDSAEPRLTELHETHSRFFDGSRTILNFDHHPGNTIGGMKNFVLPELSSTCELLVNFADTVKWEIVPDAATCLLTGIYTDTGGLLHGNTSANVYRTVARLLRSGARRQEVVDHVFRRSKLSTLLLWGRVLEKISVTEEGGAISAVTEGDFRATGAHPSELTGAIDFVNAVPGVRFSLVLSEREGQVKGSLRTLRDDVDVDAMARKLSGGGHKKAAGFALPGKLKPETRWKVVNDEANGVER